MYLAKASLSFFASASQRPSLHLDASSTQLRESATGDQRIGIAHRHKYTLYSCGDHCVGAGTGAADMRAGFEIDIERRAARSLAGFFHRQHFCVLPLFVGVRAATDDLATSGHHHGADARIGRGQRHALSGELPALAA